MAHAVIRKVHSAKLTEKLVNLNQTKRWKSVKSFHEIPRPSGYLPFFGHTFSFMKQENLLNLPKYYKKLYDECGPIFRLEFVTQKPLVFIFDPDDVKTLFMRDGEYPCIPIFEGFATYREYRKDLYPKSKGLVGEQGERWAEIRHLVQRDMVRQTASLHHLPMFQKLAEEFVQVIRSNLDEDNELKISFEQILELFYLEAGVIIGFNTRLGRLNPNLKELSKNAITLYNYIEIMHSALKTMMFGPKLWKFYNRKLFKSFDKGSDEVMIVATKFIKDLKSKVFERRDKGYYKDLQDFETSFMEKIILKCPEDSELPLLVSTDSLFAGAGTTSNANLFLLYHLSTNLPKQEILHREIRDVLGDGEVTKEGLKRMRYLRACLKESYRMMPVAQAVARKTQKEMVLCGHRIPVGTVVVNPHIVTATLDRYYDAPLEFRPERWLRSKGRATAHKFKSLPFSYGPRSCPGRHFAELEHMLVVINLLRKFELFYDVKKYGKIGCVSKEIFLQPNKPLRLKFNPRNLDKK